MARIHVAITAWRRYELTELTLRSFWEHNNVGDFGGASAFAGLWYGLDGGYDPRLPELFASYGFLPGLVETEHVGLCKSLEDLVRAVAVQLGSSEMQSDLLLLLQDDWECVRRVPLEAISELMLQQDIGTVRLYGRFKERGKRRMVDDRNHGLPGMPRIEWANREVVAPGPDGRAGERVLVGRAYWGQPPSITRLPLLLDIVKDARHERHSMRRSAEMGFLSAWLMDPVFYHTGAAQPTKNLGGHW